ncbi:putative protein LSM14 [Blattamonas nauphoetae]|uniref:FFD box profile domain-containing protein n=1 Tax=Blattamonas nauphoetae TaxID=2049346 RepID=A0ABQ9XN83_9EUKA|nr:putative protein LSM14 [Blattamonas nauphoetae]
MSDYDTLLGQRFSIITEDQQRYEGTLKSYELETSFLVLEKVQSFGTEDRVSDKFIPPGTKIAPVTSFNADNVKAIDLAENQIDPDAHQQSKTSVLENHMRNLTVQSQPTPYTRQQTYQRQQSRSTNYTPQSKYQRNDRYQYRQREYDQEQDHGRYQRPPRQGNRIYVQNGEQFAVGRQTSNFGRFDFEEAEKKFDKDKERQEMQSAQELNGEQPSIEPVYNPQSSFFDSLPSGNQSSARYISSNEEAFGVSEVYFGGRGRGRGRGRYRGGRYRGGPRQDRGWSSRGE